MGGRGGVNCSRRSPSNTRLTDDLDPRARWRCGSRTPAPRTDEEYEGGDEDVAVADDGKVEGDKEAPRPSGPVEHGRDRCVGRSTRAVATDRRRRRRARRAPVASRKDVTRPPRWLRRGEYKKFKKITVRRRQSLPWRVPVDRRVIIYLRFVSYDETHTHISSHGTCCTPSNPRRPIRFSRQNDISFCNTFGCHRFFFREHCASRLCNRRDGVCVCFFYLLLVFNANTLWNRRLTNEKKIKTIRANFDVANYWR